MKNRALRDALAGLSCLAVLAGIAWTTPTTGIWDRELHGQVNQLISGHNYDVLVQDSVLTPVVHGTQSYETDAIFVAVNVQATVKGSTASFSDLVLRTEDGAEYSALSEFHSFLPPATEPGFTTTGVAVFELPPGVVVGADLVLGPEQGVIKTFGELVVVEDVVTEQTETVVGIRLQPPHTEVLE